MQILDFLFGRPLASDAEGEQKVGVAAAVPVFGLDALSSAAYGPEAALTILIPLGLAGVAYILPISISIIVLLGIVYFSYRQTIAAYPTGGGSYTVASENLGHRAGLLAAAALMIDYVLTVAVGISAGVGALGSAVPELQPHTLEICLGILVLLAIVNLRGVRDAGAVFLVPTYLFVACLGGALLLGVFKTIASGGHPIPVVAPPKLPTAAATASAWILLKAFASGCTAMTGVEAVSNGMSAFREPVVKTAQRTLTVIIAILMALLAGIAYLARVYHVGATDPVHNYESVLSQLIGAIAGKGVFYYVSIGSILLVLALSANTAFADFPRLAHAIARDRYLPYFFAMRGRRLVFSQGVYALTFLAGSLLAIFGGVTDRLIPLYAVGAFLAFTLSQAGMVAHWKRVGGPGAKHSMIVNGVGAVATGITVCVVMVAKFVEGAWITVLLIPVLISIMVAVKRHYKNVAREISLSKPLTFDHLVDPIVVVPLERWNKLAAKAMRFAFKLSNEVQGLHIDFGEDQDNLCRDWDKLIQAPAVKAGFPPPRLVILQSPYRFIVAPIVDYVLKLEGENPGRHVAVLLPDLIERRWYYALMHNQRSQALKAMLLFRGNQRIIVVDIPWYLEDK